MLLLLTKILIIAISLSIDAIGISILSGIKSKSHKTSQAFKMASFFGLAQAIMPIIGWFIGETMKEVVSSIDHWIAFILLSVIGIKMLLEAFKKEGQKDALGAKTLLLLSLATSIDALIIGITIPILKIPLLTSAAIIGIVTFILSFLGFMFGKQIGIFFGKKIGAFAGIVLIMIGFKILIEHLVV